MMAVTRRKVRRRSPKEPRRPLDADELVGLAGRALGAGRPLEAGEHLRDALEIDPDHAKAYYLLGGLEASRGAHARAVSLMVHALELDPSFADARFQLGLLYIGSGQVSAAETVWNPLTELGEDHPLYLFARGLLRLTRDEFAAAATDLELGIERNTAKPAMNREMSKALVRARKALAAAGGALDIAAYGEEKP